MQDFGLSLSLEPDVPGAGNGVSESWTVHDDGTFSHRHGIEIGEFGMKAGGTEFRIDSSQVKVDETNLLGRGAGGVVARGVHKSSGMPLAVKIVRVEDSGKRKQLINELGQLMKVESSFLIQLYAAYVHKDSGCVHVALEYMDYGSLADVKQKTSSVPEDMLALMMMQILEGLKVLHLRYVVHRDVKLGNILVNSRGCVKVTDFGISKQLDDKPFCETFVGTATHMSPERVMGEGYTFSSDIWSLGLCVCELATGTYPYGKVPNFLALYGCLCQQPAPRLPEERFSKPLCNFVERQLQKEPERRATAIQLQAHPWILAKMASVTEVELVRWLEILYRNQD